MRINATGGRMTTPIEEKIDQKLKVRTGMVTVSDGKSRPQPVRLNLSMEVMRLQKEEQVPMETKPANSKERMVQIRRQKVGGLGLSIKGGAEHKLPILISRIYKSQAADLTGELFVGDAIIKVNGEYITACPHDDAVNILRNAGDLVVLTVKHYSAATPFLQKQDNKDELTLEVNDKEHSDESLGFSCSSRPNSICSEGGEAKMTTRWVDIITLPLMMAYVTRYIFGTDKLRPNAFEVRGLNGASTGIIHCDDSAILSQWLKYITDNIIGLTNLQMKLYNRNFSVSDRIEYMGWVNEGVLNNNHPWQNYKPRFLALKGTDLMLFDTPPLNVADWGKCVLMFKVYQTMFRVVKDSENVDERQHCFLVQTSGQDSRYLSVETRQELLRIENAWHCSVCTAVIKLGNKTFTVSCNGKTAGLTLDWNLGFSLHEADSKTPVWQYKFSQLRGSSDDGKSKLKLHFQDMESRAIETKELECSILQSLLFCMHAFLTAKVASVDPAFLCSMIPELQTEWEGLRTEEADRECKILVYEVTTSSKKHTRDAVAGEKEMLGHRHSVTQLEEPRPRLRSNRKGSLALPGDTERTLLDILDCEKSQLPTTTATLNSTSSTVKRHSSSTEEAKVTAPVSATPPPVPARPPAVPKRNYVPPLTTSTTDQLKHNVRPTTQSQPPAHPKIPIPSQKKHPSVPPPLPPPDALHPPLRVPPRNQHSLDSATLCRNNTFAASQTKSQTRVQAVETGKLPQTTKGQLAEKYMQRCNSQLPVAPMPVGMGQVFDFTATATTQHEYNVTAASRSKMPLNSPTVTAAVVKNFQNSKVVSAQSANVPPPLNHIPNGPVHRSTSNGKISVRQDSSVSSDSFSQTSSPSYTTKTMETPLLPHHGANARSGCNGKLANKTNTLAIKSQQSIENGRETNNTALTKSVSTPASLQTIVRFHNGSNMSLHHRIIRDMRRPSTHYVGQVRFRFRFAQVVVNAIALLAIAGGLAAYFKAYPAAVQIVGVNTTSAPVTLPAVTGTNPAPGICLPVIVTFCQQHKVPYNFTVFPNYMGHFTQRDAQQELEIYEAVVDVRCYELAALFLCSLFVPKCGAGGVVVRPCRSLCFETKRRCGFFLDVFGLALPDYLECGLFPESADPEECVGHLEVKEAKIRASKPVCPSGFQCDVKRCIPKDWHCDGHVDCKDQSDELNCVQCTKGMIHCGAEKCMSQEHMCDGKVDCPWAQDERNCLRLSERNGDEGYGQLEVFRPEHQQWVPACVAHWDQETSPNATCSLLGYSSSNGSRLNKGTDSNIAPPIHGGRRMHQAKRNKNLMREFGSCTGNSYPTVDLTCTDYMCGKTRKSYAERRTLRIVGGVTSKPGDWPFLAALLGGPEEIFYCAGVLIADQWVLTASHCVGNHSDVSGWTIQLGITRRHAHSYYGQKMKVRRVVPHPLYNLGVAHDNDVALFQLATRVTFHEHLLPVCLPPATKELHPGTICTVIGWGKKEDKGMSEYEPAVNEVEVPVLNRDLCNQWLENRDLNVTEGMICAGYKEGGKDACQGDSGGPLLCRDDKDRDRWFVGGIVSWGIKCAHPHLPGVYAYVPKYIPWILQQMALYSD